MNFTDYKPKLAYPRKADFTTRFFYRAGKVVAEVGPHQAPAVDVSGCVNESVFDYDTFKVAQDEYAKHERAMAEMFVVDLLHDFGMPDNAFTRGLYAIAYQQGHSSGYENIYNCFSDLAELDELAKRTYSK